MGVEGENTRASWQHRWHQDSLPPTTPEDTEAAGTDVGVGRAGKAWQTPFGGESCSICEIKSPTFLQHLLCLLAWNMCLTCICSLPS